MEDNPEDLLPVPDDENEHSMVDDFEATNDEHDDDMDEFDTKLPDEPDEIVDDVGDVVGGDDGDAD